MTFKKTNFIQEHQFTSIPEEFINGLDFLEEIEVNLNPEICSQTGYDSMGIVFLGYAKNNKFDDYLDCFDLHLYPLNAFQLLFLDKQDFCRDLMKALQVYCNPEIVIQYDDNYIGLNSNKINLNKETPILMAKFINQYFGFNNNQ